MRKMRRITRLATIAALAVGVVAARAGEWLVSDGQTIAFLGDSITQQGVGVNGYITLVKAGLESRGINVNIIGAGVGGHTSATMRDRIENDIIRKKPDWMLLSCGVNDVGHGQRGGVEPDAFRENVADMADRAQKAGIKVMLQTTTIWTEDRKHPNNDKLAAYSDFLREFATEHGLALADQFTAFWRELENPRFPRPPGHYLTNDGIHMGPFGNAVMAETILRAFGADDEDMAAVHEAWREIAKVHVGPRPIEITWDDCLAITKAAAERKVAVDVLYREIFADAVRETAEKIRREDAKQK